jgi:hypothetical protein
VEEITFDMDEPDAVSDEAIQEASFIVPEPAENEIPPTGETLSPETLAPEPPPAEEPPLTLEKPFLEEQSPEEFAVSMQDQITAPDTEVTEPPFPTSQSDFPPVQESPTGQAPPAEQVPTTDLYIPDEETGDRVHDMPGIEPFPETPAAESGTVAEPERVSDITASESAETTPVDIPPGLSEAELRKIVEEKVEKIVWEVVPEMAEVLLREAIEKIKGKS